ncbi:interaptin-like [Ostrea edulis]|uniref:interaptin-like n=1 Tax=Ostrea edulis TaxID=37623 RepID=UPI0024AF6F68|nr:interaptin-like [Ostrea edulis]
MPWDGNSPLHTSYSEREEKLAIVGVKMSLSTLSKDTKASQREFSTIIQRQSELEKQLSEVMKTLDSAKDALIREREEKAQLLQQLRFKDDELVDMQRKYRDLQNAMGKLKETNNRFHERVTKLQIENDQLRKSVKDRSNLQIDLTEKSQQIKDLKKTIEDQEKQITSQEHMINKKLNMIEQLASDHQRLADGQVKLEDLLVKQSDNIMKLSSEKESAHQLLVQQQKQLNSQQASLAVLQENLERLEMTVLTQQEQQNVLAILPPSDQNYRGKKQPTTTKPMMVRPFNASGKVENSKNSFWKNSNGNKLK